MPVKNAAPFLRDCLDSILKQSWHNWELIAIDDHSDDNSKEILESYCKTDSRIRLYTNEGAEIIAALKTAYKNCNGNYIHRMDADDLMAENKLNALYQLLIQSGKEHVATALVEYFSAEGLQEGYQKYATWLNGLCKNHSHWDEIYKECVIASPNWLIRREDLEACGAFHQQQYPEDYDLVFRFYRQQLKVVAVDEVLHLWRDHPQRSSRTLEVYKDNDFFELKWEYFQQLERVPNRPLMIWGAGKKGKKLAKLLKNQSIDFEWLSNNPKKHGKEIYEQLLKSFREILNRKNPQIIVAVGQKGAKKEIKHFLEENGLKENINYYFFC